MKKNGSWNKKRVAALRERLQLSQEELAHRVGVAWTTVSRWENGHSKPSKMAAGALDALEAKNC